MHNALKTGDSTEISVRATLRLRDRLRESAVFREAFAQSSGYAGRFMVFWPRRGQGAGRRLGVVASKRTFPRAVDRSRAKRKLRELFRQHRQNMVGDVDAVLVARRRILETAPDALKGDFFRLLDTAAVRQSAVTPDPAK